MVELSGFQRDLLVVIVGLDQPSGQDVKEELEQVYDREINHGRLYPKLDTLVQKDYVEKGTLDPLTNSYEITEQGQDAMDEWIEWSQNEMPQLSQ
ncbi:helix-turn-helix transcriptional regulator [Halegenticoccus tardaugens]|uniref:helix-turn-helix transcriptional regulator n=1 Tax=Halegenticoccus tardaugens TaxID=2071624 RepID=UPI00100ABF39|nr:helix-turn-helix transcriptional regulator [Halegenticoccus tardaugens]